MATYTGSYPEYIAFHLHRLIRYFQWKRALGQFQNTYFDIAGIVASHPSTRHDRYRLPQCRAEISYISDGTTSERWLEMTLVFFEYRLGWSTVKLLKSRESTSSPHFTENYIAFNTAPPRQSQFKFSAGGTPSPTSSPNVYNALEIRMSSKIDRSLTVRRRGYIAFRHRQYWFYSSVHVCIELCQQFTDTSEVPVMKLVQFRQVRNQYPRIKYPIY